MQESPNFTSYLNRLQSADRATVLDGRENISGADRRFLESVYERFELYFSDIDFRSQIPLQTRQYVEDNVITNILSYLETIASWQRDGVTTVTGVNLTGQIQNITNQIAPFDNQIAGYYFTYLFNTEPLGKRIQEISSFKLAAEQESQSLSSVIDNVKEQVNSRKGDFDNALSDITVDATDALGDQKKKGNEILESIENLLTKAKLLIGASAGLKLGNYYQKLANGRTIAENDKYIDVRGKSLNEFLAKFSPKRWAAYIAGASLIAYSLAMYVINNPIKLGLWESVFILVLGIGMAVFGLLYLTIKALHVFNLRYKGGHARGAALWMMGAIISTVFTAIYSSLLVHDLSANGKITWEEIIPKIIVLLAPAYLVRLCIQNYRANAHLEVQYMHRATIVNIAESYSDATTLDDPSERSNDELVKISLEARMTILTEAAKIMFAQSESGYITQKEGAGNNGDNPMDTFRNNVTIK